MKQEASTQTVQPNSSDASGSKKRMTMSDVIMAFAAPLLAMDEAGAADLDVLRQLMVLVDMCWNLPILQETDPAAYAKFKPGFDNVLREVPGPVAEQLNKLLADRTARYGTVPFLVQTRVEDDGGGKPRIVTEARKPRA